MKRSLRFKLTAAFLLLTLLTFTLLGVLANVILKKQFASYVIDNLSRKNTEIVSTLSVRYADWGGRWDIGGLESIGIGAMSDGLILRVSNSAGAVLWDARVHNSGLCAAMLDAMAANMLRQDAGFDGGYTEKTYGVVSGGKTVGTVTIGYYGPYFYTDNDIRYLNTLNLLILLAMALVGGAALVAGAVMAKRLAEPISNVIRTADRISDGDYESRLQEDSTTAELAALAGAINTLAEKLEKQESLRKRLTADVAHELRTPMANLQSHLEAMLDGVWAPDAARLKSCHEETVRLSKLVADLENLARIEGGTRALQKEPVDLHALVRRAADCFESELAAKRITLGADLPDIAVSADRDKLTQVLVNLLSNAVKYTPPGGRIEVAASEGDGGVCISVRDTGAGIAPEDLPYIFERFYRADKSRSRDTGGSGIGLAIVKSIVTAHGGSVTAKSAPGEGSEFIVTLPQ
ncbi:heavy metal sensor kinase [Sporobacter termitidis DSM 10068]|uniref:histidine kinase n=1 Tax=Sporobacter termitidis DSM 10068 TaxID=1123282 RepID=A0A1M5Z219_9FIRM|nr:ATP-binding protein [Sporobacter termitidis]SHI18184.1 heavy metal sensor kinase [Sporobacter termitidis DSM 10068]